MVFYSNKNIQSTVTRNKIHWKKCGFINVYITVLLYTPSCLGMCACINMYMICVYFCILTKIKAIGLGHTKATPEQFSFSLPLSFLVQWRIPSSFKHRRFKVVSEHLPGVFVNKGKPFSDGAFRGFWILFEATNIRRTALLGADLHSYCVFCHLTSLLEKKRKVEGF